jgi:hypothetical protein
MKRPVWLALVVVICCFGLPAANAFGKTYRVLVKAGPAGLVHAPVCVVLTESEVQANLDPVILKRARSVRIEDAGGKEIPAQLTGPSLLNPAAKRQELVVREAHFIAPFAAPGETLELKVTVSEDAPAAKGYSWSNTEGEYAELSYGDRPVLRYMYKPLDESSDEARELTTKVYHHLYDLTGERFVTKGPGGQYPHHRGLFLGFSKISYGDGQQVNTWGCAPGAHQAHGEFLSEEAGPVLGRHAVAVGWHGSEPEPFIVEQRQLTVYNVPGGQLVQFASRLASRVGKVRLDGDPQHAGFQFRASQEVAAGDQSLTYYLRPDGCGMPGETRNWDHKTRRSDCVNLPWNAMSFVVGGKRYTAAYLDHPDNPKEARYSERAFGRFGSYFEYELDEQRELEMKYRLWLQEGEMTVKEAAALSAEFVGPTKAAVR